VQSGLLTTDLASEESRPNQEEDEEDAGSDQDEGNARPNGKQDPYSNLDGAFGNYLADEPQPMAAGNRAVDDLLF
jgi:AP-2 complex subunit beta-1